MILVTASKPGISPLVYSVTLQCHYWRHTVAVLAYDTRFLYCASCICKAFCAVRLVSTLHAQFCLTGCITCLVEQSKSILALSALYRYAYSTPATGRGRRVSPNRVCGSKSMALFTVCLSYLALSPLVLLLYYSFHAPQTGPGSRLCVCPMSSDAHAALEPYQITFLLAQFVTWAGSLILLSVISQVRTFPLLVIVSCFAFAVRVISHGPNTFGVS